jgi:glycosyltransferase involved in cell wall biosynthesis
VKVGIVSQWYPPEPAFIPSSLAEELTLRGHQVRVLTGFPNYPDGQIYPGYRQRWGHRTVAEAVVVRRVPVYPSHDASALRRIATYLSFAATSSLAATRYLAGADVLYVYFSPATAFAAPALLRLLYRTPSVLHVQDLWPESVTESSMAPRGRVRRIMHATLDAAVRKAYRMAAGIAVISPTMRELVVARGADPGTIRVVMNWTDESEFRPVPATESARREIGHRGRCTVMHAGNNGPFQHIEGAVRAAAAPAVTGRVDLVLLGSGINDRPIRALAAHLQATNIRFLARRPLSELAPLYAAADYQLVSLRNLPILHGTIPSKLPAALSCGSPVIAAAPGDCAHVVEQGGAGLSCPPEDWRTLADRFKRAASMPQDERAEMGRRALALYRDRMSRREGVNRLEAMLRAAAGGRLT